MYTPQLELLHDPKLLKEERTTHDGGRGARLNSLIIAGGWGKRMGVNSMAKAEGGKWHLLLSARGGGT